MSKAWFVNGSARGNSEKVIMECEVCHQLLEEEFIATCIACGKKFHFFSSPLQGQDCGYVLALESCGLAFMCAPCFNK